MSALVSVQQAASILGVTDRTIRRKCEAGHLPAEQVAGRRGGKSGTIYMIPAASLHSASSTQVERPKTRTPREVQEPINLSTFLERGGHDAIAVASSRRKLIEAAKSVTGPNKTAKLKALAAHAGVSLAALYKWMDLKGKRGEGLEGAAKTIRSKFDERGMRRRTSLPPEARDFFHMCWLQQNKPPVPMVIELYYKPKALEMGWPIPSRATFYRLISQDLTEFERTLAREGVGAVRSSLLPKNSLAAPTRKHFAWVADTRTHDFWVIHPVTGEPFRPHLLAIVDAASRVLVGSAPAFTPNADAFRRAFTKAVYAEAPMEMALPKYLLVDNGSEFQNKVNVKMIEDLGIIQYDCEVGAGWAKGAIESYFKLVSLWFDRAFDSWTGHNVLARPEGLDEKRLAKEGRLISWEEYQILLAQFEYLYNFNRPHSGDGMNNKTPMERYAELPSARIGVPTPKVMELLGLKEERRKVTDDGIKLFNKLFYHPDLYEWENAVRRPLTGEWVTVRFDPSDETTAYVFYEGEAVCRITDKPKPTFDPEDKENVAIAGAIHAKGQKLLRTGLERLHDRKAEGYMNPLIPPLDKPAGPHQPKIKPARMITPMDRAVQQFADQDKQEAQAVEQTRKSSNVSTLLAQIGKSALA